MSAQPSSLITIQYGPWTPDLGNVPVALLPYAWQPTTVPCADCLNVYYADGAYKSLPSPAQQSDFSSGTVPIGAYTWLDAGGNTGILAGTINGFFGYQGGNWIEIGGFGASSPVRWQFAQVGQTIYMVDGAITGAPNDALLQLGINDDAIHIAGLTSVTGSITSNVLTVTAVGSNSAPIQVGSVLSAPGVTVGTNVLSLGSGTGGTGTYDVSTTPNVGSQTIDLNLPPAGSVLGVSGQFLVQGNINFQWANNAFGTNAFALGTGDGTTTVFSGTIANTPIQPKSVTVYVNGVAVGTDNGDGIISSASVFGNINYSSGVINATFTTAPASSAALTVSYTESFPERVWWSAVDLPGFWPAPLTNAALAFQSGYEDLEADFGPVMAIVGYPLYFLVFQRSGITRATYQGGNVVFAFAPYEFKRGLIAQSAWVQVGPNVYYLSDQGFFYTDGANVYPVGTAPNNAAGIDNWFWANVNKAALSAISPAYDASSRSVMFAIPTGTNTLPDTLLIYNLLAQQWTKAAVPASLIWSDTDGTRHRVGIMGQLGSGGGGKIAYQLLVGAPATGYLESCDLNFTDGLTRTTLGVRPQIACTDTPSVVLGARNTLSGAVAYTSPSTPDSFGGGFAPVLSESLYTRVRVGSAAASAINGAVLDTQVGGPV